MDYREKFKELRLDHDLKQTDVAKLCHVARSTVGHWEKQKRHMSVDCIITLCLFYRVSADYILELPKDLYRGCDSRSK